MAFSAQIAPQERFGGFAAASKPLIRLGLRPIHLLPQGEKEGRAGRVI